MSKWLTYDIGSEKASTLRSWLRINYSNGFSEMVTYFIPAKTSKVGHYILYATKKCRWCWIHLRFVIYMVVFPKTRGCRTQTTGTIETVEGKPATTSATLATLVTKNCVYHRRKRPARKWRRCSATISFAPLKARCIIGSRVI